MKIKLKIIKLSDLKSSNKYITSKIHFYSFCYNSSVLKRNRNPSFIFNEISKKEFYPYCLEVKTDVKELIVNNFLRHNETYSDFNANFFKISKNHNSIYLFKNKKDLIKIIKTFKILTKENKWKTDLELYSICVPKC